MKSHTGKNLKTCPDPETLAEFLSGKLPIDQQETCEMHLEICDPCVATIRDLKVDDTLSDLARDAWNGNPQEELASEGDAGVVDGIIERMKSISVAGSSPLQTCPRNNVDDRAAEVQRLLEPPTSDQMIGRLDRYEIESLLGAGSTGVVYKAIDTQLGRPVAIKILRPSLGEPAKKRFVAEARATAQLSHPNIIAIYDVGTSGDLAYIAMNWEQGQTLEQRLAAVTPLTVDETKSLAVQIGNGLAHAHEQGLIHRDIKPANIWITENLTARILDFGLVRITDEDPQLTCTGLIAGTPCFMSPEQSRGAEMDSRSDLFSLGCLLYRSLTGKLPFRSDNALATLQSIQREQPTPPAELDTTIPKDVSDLVMCLLEKAPGRRPPSAEKFVAALNSERKQWPFDVAKYQAGFNKIEPPTSGSWWKAIAALILVSALGLIGYFFSPQITRIVTNQGEIVIDTKVDDVKIEVVENGQVLRVIDLATENSIVVRAGQYEIRPKGIANQVEIKNNNLRLTRGETEIVSITRKPKTGGDSNPSGLQGGRGYSNPSRTGFGAADPVKTVDANEPYRAAAGDVLGVFVEGVLGQFDSDPPIHYPPAESGLPPSIGFPIPVDHDGTISLPLVEPVKVAGKTIVEIKAMLTKAYKGDGEERAKAETEALPFDKLDANQSGLEDGPILRPEGRIFVSQIQTKASRQRAVLQATLLARPKNSAAKPSLPQRPVILFDKQYRIEKKILELQIELQQARERVGASHPEIKSLEEQIQFLRHSIVNPETQASLNPSTAAEPSRKQNASPVFNGKTYQQWLRIATTETNPLLLIEPHEALVQLWGEQDQGDNQIESELFDTMVKLDSKLTDGFASYWRGENLEHINYATRHRESVGRFRSRLSPEQSIRFVAKEIKASGKLDSTVYSSFLSTASTVKPDERKKFFDDAIGFISPLPGESLTSKSRCFRVVSILGFVPKHLYR